MSQLFANNAASILDGAIAQGETTITLHSGASFPSPTGTDYFLLTLAGLDANGNETSWEIVKVTARAGNDLTVVRAQESTTNKAWPSGTRAELRITAGTLAAVSNSGQGSAGVALSGDVIIYATQSKTYAITNYNVFSSYVVQVSAGSVSLSGDQISFTAPAIAQTVTLTVVMDGVATAFHLPILAAGVATPTSTSPSDGASNQTSSVALTSSAFAWYGLVDTHLDSDWQLATDAGFTSVVQSASADAANKTAWMVSGLSVSQTYYWRVRHRGANNGVSAWSTGACFTTAATFDSYIPTPTPTPANFGDAFEGGFYGGLYWDQIAQSASSKTLATGTQTFTVPNMADNPIVYAGQELEVRSRANPASKFIGTVTGAQGTTLTLAVSSISGSGMFGDWSVMSRFRAVFAPKSSGEHAGVALKNANTGFPSGCQSLVDGWTATNAMKNADTATVYPAAHWARGLIIGGKTDWHIPARDVLELAWRNLKPNTDANYIAADRPASQSFDYKINGAYGDTSNRHGINNNSSPAGPTYTASAPGQAAASAFKTGGAEAFEFGAAFDWSSTEYSATLAWFQCWDSSYPGFQNNYSKVNTYRVRAVRRSII